MSLYISRFSLAFVVVVVGFVFLRFSSKRDIMNFRVMAVRDIELRTCLSKNIYLSCDFWPIQELKCVNACLLSTDDQSPRWPR